MPGASGSAPIVVALGSINVDIEARAAAPGARAHVVRAQNCRIAGGGKAANVAFAARRLGVPSALVGHVGNDLLGRIALAPLEAAGVDCTHVHVVRDHSTGVALMLIGAHGEPTVTVFCANANDVWLRDEVQVVQAAVTDRPVGSVLVLDVEMPSFVALAAMEAARSSGHQVVLDPAPVANAQDAMLALADFVTPDAAEAELLTGIPVDGVPGGMHAGRALLARGARCAIVKLPRGGCVVVGVKAAIAVHGSPVAAVDTTGAGDAFAAALAVALTQGASLEEASRWGVAASMVAVTREGAQSGCPDRDALEAALPRTEAQRLSAAK